MKVIIDGKELTKSEVELLKELIEMGFDVIGGDSIDVIVGDLSEEKESSYRALIHKFFKGIIEA